MGIKKTIPFSLQNITLAILRGYLWTLGGAPANAAMSDNAQQSLCMKWRYVNI